MGGRRRFLLWCGCCGISSWWLVLCMVQTCPAFVRTLYSARASFHEFTRAESSQISSCAILLFNFGQEWPFFLVASCDNAVMGVLTLATAMSWSCDCRRSF